MELSRMVVVVMVDGWANTVYLQAKKAPAMPSAAAPAAAAAAKAQAPPKKPAGPVKLAAVRSRWAH